MSIVYLHFDDSSKRWCCVLLLMLYHYNTLAATTTAPTSKQLTMHKLQYILRFNNIFNLQKTEKASTPSNIVMQQQCKKKLNNIEINNERG